MLQVGNTCTYHTGITQQDKGIELLEGIPEVCAHAGLLAFMVTALSTLLSYETKLKAFMADIAGEDLRAAGPSTEAVKGD